jgi:hypothetical protein
VHPSGRTQTTIEPLRNFLNSADPCVRRVLQVVARLLGCCGSVGGQVSRICWRITQRDGSRADRGGRLVAMSTTSLTGWTIERLGDRTTGAESRSRARFQATVQSTCRRASCCSFAILRLRRSGPHSRCSNALALKTGMAGDRHRGFESHTLRSSRPESGSNLRKHATGVVL